MIKGTNNDEPTAKTLNNSLNKFMWAGFAGET
jgi:hypothetical protein